MVKILYSIMGEGRGHSTRSVALIQKLEKKHKIKIIVAGKNAYEYIKNYYPDAIQFQGVNLFYKKNKVDRIGTAKHYLKDFLAKYPKSLKIIYTTIRNFKPDIVITDFEGSVAYIAKTLGYKVMCVCNNHAMTKLEYDVPKRYMSDFRETKFIVNAIFPKIDYHLITTFFYPPMKEDNVYLFPPILRDKILKLKPYKSDYVLIYQTSDSNKKLVEQLKKIKHKFIVYGFNVDKKEDNLIFKSFSEKEFIKDLEGCKAVIANGGYSLISEALSLHKPILSIPIRGQFEQILNAMFIKKLGYGEIYDTITVNRITDFIKNLKRYESNLKDFKREDNSKILAKIEEIIKKECSS
jgi:uncharacterized protein (TIGR00661 family)